MTEFEERLTHEYSTLAEQYAQEQKELSGQVASLGKQVRQWAEQYAREQTRLGDQVASLGAHVRRLADQSAQERKAHTEWASTLVEQQQQLGAHVTTLTTEYEGLLENVNRMIDASNQCYERVGRHFFADPPRG